MTNKLVKGGEHVLLQGKSGKVWGAGIKSRDDTLQPLIVSQGHRISLATAIKVVLSVIRGYKVPLPVKT